METALNYMRAEGVDVRLEDVARLSPLGYKHINFLGQYSFDLAETVAQGRYAHSAPRRNHTKISLSVRFGSNDTHDPDTALATQYTQN
jgi:Tn3 transposase DDE domain